MSPFLTRFTTLASTAPVPDAERQTASPSVRKTCFVFSTHGSYSSTKSSLRWFIMGTYMARVTLSGTLVGPGSMTRYSNTRPAARRYL